MSSSNSWRPYVVYKVEPGNKELFGLDQIDCSTKLCPIFFFEFFYFLFIISLTFFFLELLRLLQWTFLQKIKWAIS